MSASTRRARWSVCAAAPVWRLRLRAWRGARTRRRDAALARCRRRQRLFDAPQPRERRRFQQRDLDRQPLMLGRFTVSSSRSSRLAMRSSSRVRELLRRRRGSSARSSGDDGEHRLVRAAGDEQQVADEAQQVADTAS